MFSFSSPLLDCSPCRNYTPLCEATMLSFLKPKSIKLVGPEQIPVESGGLHADAGVPLCATQLRLSIPTSFLIRWMKQGPFMSCLLQFCNEGKVRVTFLSWMKFTSPLAFVYIKAVLKDNFLIWNDEMASNSTFMFCWMISQWKMHLHEDHQPRDTMRWTQSIVLNLFTFTLVLQLCSISDSNSSP